jgi:hypothetical protein
VFDAIERERDASHTRAVFDFLQSPGFCDLTVGERRHATFGRKEIDQNFLPLAIEISREQTHASGVAAGIGERVYQA